MYVSWGYAQKHNDQIFHHNLSVTHADAPCVSLFYDQDNNLNLISLSILITWSLDNVWILQGEVTC